MLRENVVSAGPGAVGGVGSARPRLSLLCCGTGGEPDNEKGRGVHFVNMIDSYDFRQARIDLHRGRVVRAPVTP